jgi:hypothetical protein
MSIWQSGTFYIGETWVISGYVRDANGVIVNLTGATIQLRVTLGNSVIFDLVGTILQPPTTGAYQFEITPDQQTGLVLTTYRYEVRAVLADGAISVQNVGEITIIPSKFVNFPTPMNVTLVDQMHVAASPAWALLSSSAASVRPQ